MKYISFIRNHIAFTFFLIIFITVIGNKLITTPTPFYDWDESLYIQNGREMIEAGYFVMPLWQGEVWLDKPPLIPLLYGTVAKISFFTQPEISTRVFSLLIASVVLTMTYALYYQITKKKYIALLTSVITAFTPLFLQRSQTVNLDIFVIMSWLGYILFYKHFWRGSFFLFIGIMSKSLIGFFPAGIVLIYQLYRFFVAKEISSKELKKVTTKIIIQIAIMMGWFVSMYLVFGNDFFNQHIIESHFKRVSSSIESHFGQRTYYIDVLIEQIGLPLFIISLGGIGLSLYQFIKKQITLEHTLKGNFLLPWFLFLNITKTKIFWYLLPALPQFGFYATYPLTFLAKRRMLYLGIGLMIVGVFLYRNIYQMRYLDAEYSGNSSHVELALYAKTHCENITMLMSPPTREAYKTLSDLDLTITTTDWWGEHPSTVYYSERPIAFIYDKEDMMKRLNEGANVDCVVVSDEDLEIMKKMTYKPLPAFETLHLFKYQALSQ